MIKSQSQGTIESNKLLFSRKVLDGELRRAIREGRIADCTIDEINNALMFFVDENNKPVCPYSGTELTISNLHLEHIIPISLGGGTVAENLIPSCSSCNFSKNGNHMIEWYEIQPFFTIERFQKIVDYIIFSINNKKGIAKQNIDIHELNDFDPIIQTSGDIWETQEDASVKYLKQQEEKLKFDEFLFQCILKLNENGIFHNKAEQNYMAIYNDLIERRIIDLSDNELNIQQAIYNKIKNIVKNKYSTTLNINYKLVAKNIEIEQVNIVEYLNNRFEYLKQLLNVDDKQLGLLIENIPRFVSYSYNEVIEIFSILKDKQINNLYLFIINNKSLFNNDIKNIVNLINKNCEILGSNCNNYLNGFIPESTIADLRDYYNYGSIEYFYNKKYKSKLVNIIIGNSSIRNQLIKGNKLYEMVEELIITDNYDKFKMDLRLLFDDSVTNLEFEFKYFKIINHNEFIKNIFLERFKRKEIKKINKEEFELQKSKILRYDNIKNFNIKEHNYKSQIQTIFATNSAFGTAGTENYCFIHLSEFNEIAEDLINGEQLNSTNIKQKLKSLFLENGYTEEMFEMKYEQYLTHEKIYYLINLERIKRERIKIINNKQLTEMVNKINSIEDKKELIGKEFAFKNKLQLQFSRNTNIKGRLINPANFNEIIDNLRDGLEFGSLEFKQKLYTIFNNNGYSYDEFLDKYKNIILNYEIINNIELMKVKEKRIKDLNTLFIKSEISKINEVNTVKELSRKDYWYLEKLRSTFVGNSNINGEKLGNANFTELIEILLSGKSLEDKDIKAYFYNIFYRICNGNQELITQKYNQYLSNDDIKIYLILEKKKRERIKEIYKEKYDNYKNLILTAASKEELLGYNLYFKANIQTILSNNSGINNKKKINLSEFKDISEKLILGYDIRSEEIKQELLLIFLKNGRTENEFKIKYKTICEHPELYINIELERLKRKRIEQFQDSLGGKKK